MSTLFYLVELEGSSHSPKSLSLKSGVFNAGSEMDTNNRPAIFPRTSDSVVRFLAKPRALFDWCLESLPDTFCLDSYARAVPLCTRILKILVPWTAGGSGG
jgi:hypothetical protein